MRASFDDTPPDVRVLEVLSAGRPGNGSGAAAVVAKVEWEGGLHVLRTAADPEGVAVEVAVGRRIRHPCVVAPSRWGRTPGNRPFLLRPFVEGRAFDVACRAGPIDAIVSWTRALLGALDALHGAGLVHKDLKASNVLVGPDGPRLVDLDLSGRAAQGGGASGSAHHFAPEVLLGGPHAPAADLFSLGAMLAFAFCGEPAKGFHLRFPRQPFWTAAHLEPEDVPRPLAPLVRALVRRSPADRPESARAAAALLEGRSSARAELRLAPLAGRAGFLEEVSELAQRPNAVVLVDVPDPSESRAVFDELALHLTLAGREVLALPVDDDRSALRIAADAREASCVVRVGADVSVPAVAGLVRDGLHRTASSSAFVVVLPGNGSRRVLEALGDAAARDVSRRTWPPVPLEALFEHLDRLSAGASPGMARQLATRLHERTEGRLAEVDSMLARGLEHGVLRADPETFALLRDDWPAATVVEESWRRELSALAADELALVRAVVLLERRADWESARRVARLGADAFAGALAALRERGLVRDGLTRKEALQPANADGADAALAGLTHDELHEWRARCAETLRAAGVPAGEVALHELALATTPEHLERLLDVADEERARGRLGLARRIAQSVQERAGAGERLRERAVALQARLEIGQGNAAMARALLEEQFGADLSRASAATLLVAAEVAELDGRRAQARELFDRVDAPSSSREERLRARIGKGYGLYLDGDHAGALSLTEEEPTDADSDTVAAMLLNLRGGALARLGRMGEAAACLDRALQRASACADPTLVGRAELNRAFVARRTGRTQEALSALRRAETSFDAADHVRMRALAANNLGTLQRDLGDLAAARTALEESLRLRRRLGDAHGTAATLASRALVTLEAGEVGTATRELGHARDALRAGGYSTELGYVELHLAAALALGGAGDAAREVLSAGDVREAARDHPLLLARAQAAVHLVRGERSLGQDALRAACAPPAEDRDPAEVFRTASMWCALAPGNTDAARALRRSADALGSQVRDGEARWRTRGRDGLALIELESCWERFVEAGRTDLVHAAGSELASALDRAGLVARRRQVAARASQALDALTDEVAPELREETVRRVLELAAAGADGRDGERAGARVPAANQPLGVDWFLDCNRRMAAERDLEGLLGTIVDMALEVSEGRRGYLVLLDGDAIDVRVAREREVDPPAAEHVQFSTTVVLQVVREGAPVVTNNATLDGRFAEVASVRSLDLRSVLCVPLIGAEEVRGALYVDNDQRDAVFDDVDIERVRGLADQASIAIVNLSRRSKIEALNQRLERRVAFQAQELERARSLLKRRGATAPMGELVGESEAMTTLYGLIERFAPADLPVLISGPSGTGKELVARALHEHSARASGPLVIENVAALPAALLESELFGHVRGAFTGADAGRKGLFGEADRGTFFLDEVAEMPLEVQAKLLRVIETGEFRSLGSRRAQKVEVRILAATHKPLSQLVAEGKFRRDLYYRLNAAEIRVPSLDERLEDVPLLIEHFLAKLNEKHRASKTMTEEVLAALLRRPWPGEVRELQNEVARLFLLSEETLDDPGLVRPPDASEQQTPRMPQSLRLVDVERAAVLRALEAAGRRKDRAAKLLGVSRAGLYTKLRKLGIECPKP